MHSARPIKDQSEALRLEVQRLRAGGGLPEKKLARAPKRPSDKKGQSFVLPEGIFCVARRHSCFMPFMLFGSKFSSPAFLASSDDSLGQNSKKGQHFVLPEGRGCVARRLKLLDSCTRSCPRPPSLARSEQPPVPTHGGLLGLAVLTGPA